MKIPCPHCGERIDVASDPEGVTLEDKESGRLRFDRTCLVLDGGRYRTLTLRVGRGLIRDATSEERREVMRDIARRGGRVSASKLSAQQRSERARRASMALPPEQRSERARKAGAKGGAAIAAKRTPEERSEAARRAAKAGHEWRRKRAEG